MKNKSVLKKMGFLLTLCLTLFLMMPSVSAKATEENPEGVYELTFTPGSGLPEELDKGNTDYAYQDLGKTTNGESKQAVYQMLEEVANDFWGNTEYLTSIEGEQYALLATIHTSDLGLSAEELMEVYLMFKNDHPVYYFLSNTVSVSGTDLLVMTNVVNGADRANMEKNLKGYLEGYASCIDTTSNYITAKAMHDILVGKMSYCYEEDGVTPEDEYWAHSIEGAVMRNQGVCEAYAKTYQMLLNYYGIENVYVTGVAGGDNHAWNMVKLEDGLYYYVDATWNDTSSTEQYFACGEDFTKDHTCDTPNGTGGNYLYGLPEAAEDNYIKKVAVYQDGELIGKCSSFEKVFELVTDENGQYLFEIIGSAEESYSLPEGEWPKAKLLEFSYIGNAPDSEYYMVTSFVFTGNVYLNSDVKFNDVSLDCALDDYISDGVPTLYARTYTMYFSGIGNYLGASNVIVSPEEVYSMGLRIEGPEATLVSDASDRLELRASDVTIGTVYMNSWLSIRGGSFVCDTLTFSEEVDQLTWSSFYNEAITFDVENMLVEAQNFGIHNSSPNDNNTYRIGKLSQKEREFKSLAIFTTIGTGKKIPSALTIESFEDLELQYTIKYYDTSDYTKEQLEQLCQEAENEGDSSKYSFYFSLLWHMTEMERYPSESPEDLLTYKGKLLNIGTSDVRNLNMSYEVLKEYQNNKWYSLDDYLEVDSEGNVSRAKDEVIIIEDGVLKKAKFFNRSDVSYVIPETVTAIVSDVDVFQGVADLTITKNVEQLDEFYFGYNDFSNITVAEDNDTYASLEGVLYNKDLTKLIVCPSRKTGALVVPESVVSLAFNAFNDSSLTKIVLPASIETLQGSQFQWNPCEEIEVDCRTVERHAFFGAKCKSLTLDSNVNYIGSAVLEYASQIESIYILNPCVELVADAFASMDVDSVTVYGYAGSTAEEYVTTYGEEYGLVFSALPGTPASCFLWETADAGVTITGVTDEGKQLTEIIIPSEIDGAPVVKIGLSAFSDLSNLQSVVIPDSVTELGNWAFSYCSNLTNVVLPANLTSLSWRAFSYCTALESIELPESLKSIGANAFDGCTALKTIELPEGLTHIYAEAFNNCDSLESFYIPKNVTYIAGGDIVAGCDSLISIVVDKENTVYSSCDAEGNECNVIVKGTVLIAGWPMSVLPNNITEIEDYAFYNCAGMTAIIIPEGVTRIGEQAFLCCENVTSIYIPASVTNIEDAAFRLNTSVTSIVVDGANTVYTSRNAAGEECNAIIDIANKKLVTGCETTVIPADVVEIGESAMEGYDGWTSVVIPEGITTIGEYAYRRSINATSIEIPDSVTSIGAWAFSECYALTEIVIPEGITELPDRLFNACGALNSVTVPKTVTAIGDYTFAGCNAVTLKVYADSYAETYAVEKGIPYEVILEDTPSGDTALNGVALGSDGLWAYYVNGVVDTTFTGLAANESGTWYIENGYLNWDFTDLFSWTDGWYYVMGGRVPTEYTGLVRNSAGLWYVENGMINWNYTNLVNSAEGWFYVMDGRVTEEYTGLVRNDAGLWYVAGGKLDETHTDLVSSMEGWFYVMNGRVTEEYTGLVRNSEGLWYIANGKLDDTYTNLVSSVEGWFYAMNGRVTEEYTGLVANENGNWYVDKGAVSLTHEGLICDATGWWYVVQSHVANDFTGLATNDAGTWYVQNGYLDFGFSGEVLVGKNIYTVVGGMVQ